jgi:hypothetical protein
VQRQELADDRTCGKTIIAPDFERSRGDDMLAAAELEHGGARRGRVPRLAALVDRALLERGSSRRRD